MGETMNKKQILDAVKEKLIREFGRLDKPTEKDGHFFLAMLTGVIMDIESETAPKQKKVSDKVIDKAEIIESIKSSGMTYAQIAAKTGICRKTVKNIVKNQNVTHLKILARLDTFFKREK